MNAIPNGRVHILDRDTQAELDALALLRQQQHDCAVLAAVLTNARTIIATLSFPFGYPAKGHDLETALDLLGELMPTQTEAEMELAASVAAAETQLSMRGV